MDLSHLSFIHLLLLLLSSPLTLSLSLTLSPNINKQQILNIGVQETQAKRLKQTVSIISTNQKDVTTLPLTNPSTINPTDDSPTITNPASPKAPGSSSGSWCVATQSASQTALQAALDYACGHSGADCSLIQPGGSCFTPVTVRDHASYAFNSYYQKNPIPTSCNFGGSAITTNTDPSYGTCQYPSISTTSSVLNTTNSIGSRVFGAGPITPSPPSAAAMPSCIYILFWIHLAPFHTYLFSA